MTEDSSEDNNATGKKVDKLAPAAAILAAVRDTGRKVPITPVTIGVGVGIGSAALMAALLYAGRKRSARDKG